MKPTLVPCITGKKTSGYDVHLFSPSKRNPLVRAKQQTIVDCLTHGLRIDRGKHLDPVSHYLWYVDFVSEVQGENDLVFVAPDCDWLEPHHVHMIKDRWLEKITTRNCLVVPGTCLFEKSNCVGYALQPKQSGPVHPEWTHSFSETYKQIEGQTKRWTFDTIIN